MWKMTEIRRNPAVNPNYLKQVGISSLIGLRTGSYNGHPAAPAS
jgi:hypothetical protein